MQVKLQQITSISQVLQKEAPMAGSKGKPYVHLFVDKVVKARIEELLRLLDGNSVTKGFTKIAQVKEF